MHLVTFSRETYKDIQVVMHIQLIDLVSFDSKLIKRIAFKVSRFLNFEYDKIFWF